METGTVKSSSSAHSSATCEQVSGAHTVTRMRRFACSLPDWWTSHINRNLGLDATGSGHFNMLLEEQSAMHMHKKAAAVGSKDTQRKLSTAPRLDGVVPGTAGGGHFGRPSAAMD